MHRLLFLLAVAPLFADQASKTKKIEDLLDKTKVEESMKAARAQTRAALQQQFATVGLPNPQAIADDVYATISPLLDEAFRRDKIRPRLIRLYDEMFSEEEIAGIVEFYNSAAGRALLEKMPKLTAKSIAISQDVMKDVMPKVMEELPRIMRKYEAPQLPSRGAEPLK